VPDSTPNTSDATRPQSADAALAARALLGDSAAFGELVRPHLPRALLLATRILRVREDAEDLVQDAVLRALDRLDQYDRARPFAPWFFRLLCNLGLTRRESIALRSHEIVDPDVFEARASPDAAHQAEFWRIVDEAMDTLPPRQRLVLTLYDVDGYSGADIATMLDLSPETVRWHLHKARKAMQPLLARLRT
jgi:RNA polymerase sigma-70 factor (ECF subfamily)